MNKRKLHHYWTKIRGVKTWQLVILALISGWSSIYGLRQNSINLEPKVQAVIAADEKGEGIEEAVNQLGYYVTHHMNAELPRPLQLEKSYNRAVEKAYDNALESLHSGSLLNEAKEVCSKLGVIVSPGPQCIQDYLDKNWNPDRGSLVVDYPDPALFTYQFASPAWSPDLAGWSILATVFLTVIIIGRLAAAVVVKKILKKHE